jgi:hypothetical protein
VQLGDTRVESVDELVAWFRDHAERQVGLNPAQSGPEEAIAGQTMDPVIEEALVRVVDEGPPRSRAAALRTLRMASSDTEALRAATLRWLTDPAPWLTETGPDGVPFGQQLAHAVQAGLRTPAILDAALDRADEDGTLGDWASWLALKEPDGRAVDFLVRAIPAHLDPSPAKADDLAWRIGARAPHRLAEVARALADRPEPVRRAFLREAGNHLDDPAPVREALGLEG